MIATDSFKKFRNEHRPRRAFEKFPRSNSTSSESHYTARKNEDTHNKTRKYSPNNGAFPLLSIIIILVSGVLSIFLVDWFTDRGEIMVDSQNHEQLILEEELNQSTYYWLVNEARRYAYRNEYYNATFEYDEAMKLFPGDSLALVEQSIVYINWYVNVPDDREQCFSHIMENMASARTVGQSELIWSKYLVAKDYCEIK